MKRRLPLVVLLCAAGAAVWLPACSKRQPSQGEEVAADLRKLPGTVFDVAYTPNTVKVDSARWQQRLLSVSTSGRVWVFEPGDDVVMQLAEGKIMFLENLAVMRVLGVADVEGKRVIVAARAGLPDLVQKGKIAWSVPIRFSGSTTALRRPQEHLALLWERLVPWPVLHAAGGGAESASGEDAGWKYSLRSQPGEKRLDLSFRISKDLDGLGASLEGKGHVNEFVSAASMTVDGGSMSEMTFANSNLSGEFAFNWAATRGGGSAGIGESKIQLPSMYTAPLPIGGIPFVLSVGEQLIVKPGFGAKNEAASGSFTVTFGGGEGISIKNGGTPEAKENLDAAGRMDATTSVSLAPHAMLIAVAVPKVTLGLGTKSGFELLNKYVPAAFADRVAEQLEKTLLSSVAKKFVKEELQDKFKTEAAAYVQVVTVFTVTTAGSLSLIPCKLERITVLGQAGADATMLGQQIGDKKIDLFKKTIANRQPDVNACGEK